MKHTHIDVTVGNTRLIQDEKGQTIIIDGKESFVCWEVLEMEPEEIRQRIAASAEQLREALGIPEPVKVPDHAMTGFNEQDMKNAYQAGVWQDIFDASKPADFAAWLKKYTKYKVDTFWTKIDPDNLPHERGIILCDDNSVKEGPINRIYEMAPTICKYYILLTDLLKLPK